jgi:hypothetical protein
VLILDSAGIEVGSAFFVSTEYATWLVTAKHVLCDNYDSFHSLEIGTLSYEADHQTEVRFAMDLAALGPQHLKLHNSVDVTVIRVFEQMRKTPNGRTGNMPSGVKLLTGSAIVGLDVRSLCKFEDVHVSNDVFVFGYPVSLELRDKTLPLLRKGIVAGKDYDEGNIIIDCPIFQGNSGGLTIQVCPSGALTKFQPIGVITHSVLFKEEFRSNQYDIVNVAFQNSGYGIVEPMDRVLDLSQ